MKRNRRRFAFTDGPTPRRWYTVEDYGNEHIHLILANKVFRGETTREAYLALAYCKGAVGPDSLTESRARTILRMLATTDGLRLDGLEEWEKAFAAALVMLPLNRRALLYYECCDRLGFDPAEDVRGV